MHKKNVVNSDFCFKREPPIALTTGKATRLVTKYTCYCILHTSFYQYTLYGTSFSWATISTMVHNF